jgi:hypothetical protein
VRRLLRTGVNGQPLRAARARRERFELYHHHQEIQPVPAPASQPHYLRLAETRAQSDRCAEAQELSFKLPCAAVDTFMARVYMKLMNFRRLDPQYSGKDWVGAGRQGGGRGVGRIRRRPDALSMYR